MKFNWKNKIENVVLIALTVIAVKFTMVKPLEKQIEKQNKTIVRLAEKEKYSYQILNKFEKKLKNKNGELVLNLDNVQENKTPQQDTMREKQPEKDPGFFKRLFNPKKEE